MLPSLDDGVQPPDKLLVKTERGLRELEGNDGNSSFSPVLLVHADLHESTAAGDEQSSSHDPLFRPVTESMWPLGDLGGDDSVQKGLHASDLPGDDGGEFGGVKTWLE